MIKKSKDEDMLIPSSLKNEISSAKSEISSAKNEISSHKNENRRTI